MHQIKTQITMSLYDALEIIDSVEYYEPTDDQMMSMFGTKWHDGL